MNARKQKEKDRRRARKLADEAWQAVEAGDTGLAEKLIRRAVSTQVDNPRLWNDQGLILVLRANDGEADRAFRYAIRMARDFAEPYHHLAAVRARQGRLDDAVALQADAERAPIARCGSAALDRVIQGRGLLVQVTGLQPARDAMRVNLHAERHAAVGIAEQRAHLAHRAPHPGEYAREQCRKETASRLREGEEENPEVGWEGRMCHVGLPA